MKVYIAGSFAGRARIRKWGEFVAGQGYTVLSRWYNDDDFVEKAWDHDMGGKVGHTMAMQDIYAILEADIVIVDTLEPSTTGGRYAELGAAVVKNLLGHRTSVIHIGPNTNIFETLSAVHYPTWEDFVYNYFGFGPAGVAEVLR